MWENQAQTIVAVRTHACAVLYYAHGRQQSDKKRPSLHEAPFITCAVVDATEGQRLSAIECCVVIGQPTALSFTRDPKETAEKKRPSRWK